ncbi:unnamed protein product [Spodoptera littoralis]|uniref:Uncharacterized protein n=1 Tax=Spodoptera littoralis TaxID=7109 RepID=A0A9P0IFT5_SPOLI|nr:unnamed protein product [Spodoptera littoralis]CAH1644310.1 unnamed protein product [Spodoptera littoralis]
MHITIKQYITYVENNSKSLFPFKSLNLCVCQKEACKNLSTFTVEYYVDIVKAIQTSLVRHINWLIAAIDSVRHSKEFNARGLELASLTTLYTMAFLCILAFGYDITPTSNLTLL